MRNIKNDDRYYNFGYNMNNFYDAIVYIGGAKQTAVLSVLLW